MSLSHGLEPSSKGCPSDRDSPPPSSLTWMPPDSIPLVGTVKEIWVPPLVELRPFSLYGSPPDSWLFRMSELNQTRQLLGVKLPPTTIAVPPAVVEP